MSDPSAVWVLQHGRCVALAVAIKEAPQKLLSDKYRAVVLETVLKNVANDRVSRVIILHWKCIQYSGLNSMALLTAEFCAYDHDSPLTCKR